MSGYRPPQSAEEVFSRYRDGERYFGHSELDLPALNHYGPALDFQGGDLAGVDFSESGLIADFRDAILQWANFTRCNVKTCDFRGADLRGAIFRGAAIDAAEFRGALLTGADFEGAHVSGHTLEAGDQPDW